jgi:hypothetical protein
VGEGQQGLGVGQLVVVHTQHLQGRQGLQTAQTRSINHTNPHTERVTSQHPCLPTGFTTLPQPRPLPHPGLQYGCIPTRTSVSISGVVRVWMSVVLSYRQLWERSR